jgi:hypothetical protein
MATYATLGSVSHGTMREYDLIPCFADVLEKLKDDLSLDTALPEAGRVKEVERLEAVLQDLESRYLDGQGDLRDEDDEYWRSEDASNDLNETLFDELNRFAPPFVTFGSHEGDGSDYGFWWSRDAFDEAVEEGTVLKVADLPEGEELQGLADEVEYVAQVSDHGNVELYAVRRENGKVSLVNLYGVV